MQTAQGNMLESLRNVRTFLEQHAEKLGGVLKTGTRNELLQAITDLGLRVHGPSGSVPEHAAFRRSLPETAQ